jgi:hypothetical protein
MVAALQILVAAHIARRPAGPFRYALVALLSLNALAALRLAVLGGAPSPLDRPVLLADGATGPMLLACGLLALRFPDHDRRDRLGFALLGGGVAWAVVLILLGATAWSFDHLLAPAFEWLHTVPALFGLAIAGVALARAIATARSDRVAEAGLVALGFLPTLAENAAWAFDHLRVLASTGWPVTLRIAGRVAGQGTVLAVGFVVLAMLLWPGGRNRGWRRILAIATVAAGIAYFGYWNLEAAPDSPRVFAVYLGTTTSFYVLRPIGVGLAYSRSRTLWSLYDLACFALLLAVGKGISVLVMGTPPDELRFADLPRSSWCPAACCASSLRPWTAPVPTSCWAASSSTTTAGRGPTRRPRSWTSRRPRASRRTTWPPPSGGSSGASTPRPSRAPSWPRSASACAGGNVTA